MSVGRPELCVAAVALDGDHLLLVRRGADPGQGQWSLPGGRVEAGEAMVAAVVREFREETGLVAVCGPVIGWVEQMSAEHHFVIVDFQVTVLDDGPPVPGSDADEAAWFPLAEVGAMELADGLGAFLAEYELVPDFLLPLDG